jgi:hypothetical protein
MADISAEGVLRGCEEPFKKPLVAGGTAGQRRLVK